MTAAAAPSEGPAQDITGRLARYVVDARYEALPERARKQATRSLVNWMGVAIGGSRHPAVEIALAAVRPFAGPPQAAIFGRSDRIDIMNAALVNGISSHVFDFDDTDAATAVHPSAPVLPALLAIAEQRKVGGPELVSAMILGIEAECRIARAVQPGLSDIGWHATGTAGVFGAAVAVGKLIGLDADRLCHAIGLAATQPIGIREMFGSMTKSFHPGRAAQNGMLSAFLAEQGYTSSLQGIEAKRGWANLVSRNQDLGIIIERLGETFEIERNTYKPYSCGLVVHPVIDGAIALRNQHQLIADAIERVDLEVNPVVMELTAKRTPQTGLEGKFSVYYVAALGLIAGKAGESEFSDQAVRQPDRVALYRRVEAEVDPALGKDQARVKVRLKDGRSVETFVAAATGSLKNPLSDQALDAKFLDLCHGILAADRAQRVLTLCRSVETLDDAAAISRLATA